MSDPENLDQVAQGTLDLKIHKYAFALAVTNVFIIYGFFSNKYVVFLFAAMCSIRSCIKALRHNFRDADIGPWRLARL